MSKARGWCFTINNYGEADIIYLKSDGFKNRVRYLVFEKEVGEETKTPHLQDYLYLTNPLGAKALSKLLPRAHLEVARGNPTQNRTYCTKESGEVYEYGDIPAQGRRNDIEDVREAVNSGAGMREILEMAHSYQAMRAGELLMKYKTSTTERDVKVGWFWGPTGTGKTRAAIALSGDDYWISGRDLKWWDGYVGQKNVIIDDFRADFCTMHELLRILDRYPYRVQNKGGSVWLNAEQIIITCPYPPERVFVKCTEAIGQLLRRISEVIKFGTEVEGNSMPRLPKIPGFDSI